MKYLITGLLAVVLGLATVAGTRNSQTYFNGLDALYVAPGSDTTYVLPWRSAYYEIHGWNDEISGAGDYDIDLTMYSPNGDTLLVNWGQGYRAYGGRMNFYGPRIDSMRVVSEDDEVHAIVMFYKD